ncbi:3-deoxy-manno-octulosonate cytidylyltransferase [Caenispirillum salinarum]|uniref:3-deoxy-manno-octulosonate cytidylyltransferase n=1 Tax=Caenispirillum salinarum TaxID=859058 RepID=UPI00384AFAF7
MTAPAEPSKPGLATGDALVVIPARMASTRLPGKPLADIGGVPMIVQVWKRAMEAAVGPVLVACAEARIAEAVRSHGGEAVLTDPDLPSGSDRVWQAVERFDPQGRFASIVNVQGDLPTLDPALVAAALEPLADPAVDIATLVAEIIRDAERDNPNVVKAILGLKPDQRRGRALYFTRATAPTGDGPLYHHIGLYAYRRAALQRFVGLPPGVLETRERLEQLRALEDGMRIDAVLVDTVPLGVDTPDDLQAARAILTPKP